MNRKIETSLGVISAAVPVFFFFLNVSSKEASGAETALKSETVNSLQDTLKVEKRNCMETAAPCLQLLLFPFYSIPTSIGCSF